MRRMSCRRALLRVSSPLLALTICAAGLGCGSGSSPGDKTTFNFAWVLRVVNRQKPETVQSLQVRGYALCMLPAARKASVMMSQYTHLLHASTKFALPGGPAGGTSRQGCPQGSVVIGVIELEDMSVLADQYAVIGGDSAIVRRPRSNRASR